MTEAQVSQPTFPIALSPDRAITTSSEDELGRLPFAANLARAIQSSRGRDSLVYALVGPWGDGKSSVKNLVLEQLQRNGDYTIPVLQFTPWQWAAQGQIVNGFFAELAAELGQADPSAEGRRRADQVRRYSEWLHIASSGLARLPQVLSALITAAALLGLAGLTSGPLHTVLVTISILAAAVAGAIVAVSGWLTEVGNWLRRRAERAVLTLQQRKEQLAEVMRGLPSAPVLVVIDDIDRLDASEVKAVLQLIRANADLPNLVYLLLYDERVIDKTLDHAYPGLGTDALEKIVQVRFRLPELERRQVAGLAAARLKETLRQSELTMDDLYWENLFASGWADLVDNMRDAKRFLNLFSVHLRLLTNEGTLEANPSDLAAIDLLSIVEPETHSLLSSNKDLLTRGFSHEGDREILSEQFTSLANTARPEHRSAVRRMLMRLFPALDSVFGNTFHSDGEYREWRARRRVCSPIAFDIYFTLTIPRDQASLSQVTSLASATADESKFLTQLGDLDGAGTSRSALEQLQGLPELIPIENAPTLLRALFRAGDIFLHSHQDVPGRPHADGAAIWTIRRLIRDRLPEAEYIRLVVNAIDTTNAVSLPVSLASWELDSQSPAGPLSTDSEARLKEACLAAIRSCARTGQLLALPRPAFVLFRWREWSGNDEAAQWLRDRIKTKEEVANLAVLFGGIHTSGSITDPVHQASWVANLPAAVELLGQDYVDGIVGSTNAPSTESASDLADMPPSEDSAAPDVEQ